MFFLVILEKISRKEMKKMKPFGNNNNSIKTMFDSEGNMHMISGDGDIRFDSFTGRFFNDTGSGSLKQDPVTGDMWFDNGNFMEYINRNKKQKSLRIMYAIMITTFLSCIKATS